MKLLHNCITISIVHQNGFLFLNVLRFHIVFFYAKEFILLLDKGDPDSRKNFPVPVSQLAGSDPVVGWAAVPRTSHGRAVSGAGRPGSQNSRMELGGR